MNTANHDGIRIGIERTGFEILLYCKVIGNPEPGDCVHAARLSKVALSERGERRMRVVIDLRDFNDWAPQRGAKDSSLIKKLCSLLAPNGTPTQLIH